MNISGGLKSFSKRIRSSAQYHADTLPDDAVRQGLTAHPSVFLNKTLTLINPYYIRPESFTHESIDNPELSISQSRLCKFDEGGS